MRAAALLLFAVAAASAQDGPPPSLEADLDALRDDDAGRRRVAALALAACGDAAVDPLAKFASDWRWEVRRDAARALAAMDPDSAPRASSALLPFASDPVWSVREAAAPGLRPGPALDRAAADPVWRIRAASARAGSPETLRLLIKDPDSEVRAASLREIVRRADPEFRADIPALLASQEFRGSALVLFARVGGPADLELLRPLLDDPAPDLRSAALFAASRAGCRGASGEIGRFLDEIERDARSEDTRLRSLAFDAAQFLDDLGPAAIPLVGDRLEAGSPLLPFYTSLLCRSVEMDAVPFLRKLVALDPDSRLPAIAALARIDIDAAFEEAPGLLREPSFEVRLQAISILGRSERGRKRLHEELAAGAGEVRLSILRTLGQENSPETTALMQSLFASQEILERQAAYEYFARFGSGTWERDLPFLLATERNELLRAILTQSACQHPARFRAHLLGMLRDAADGSRAMALRALADSDLPGLEPEFSRLARFDPRSWIRAPALRALDNRLSIAATLPFLEAARDPAAEVRHMAVHALKRRPSASTYRAVLAAAHDPDPSVRWTAVEALGAYPEEFAVRALAAVASRDSESTLRAAAARASARFPSAMEWLATQARAETSAVARAAFAEAIAESGGAAAAKALEEFAKDESPLVRAAVADGLGRAGAAADLKILGRLAGDEDQGVRLAAIGATGQIPGRAAAALLWRATRDPLAAGRREALAALIRRGDGVAVAARLKDAGGSDEERVDISRALDEAGFSEMALEILTARKPMPAAFLAQAAWCCLELGLFDASRGLFLQAAVSGGDWRETALHYVGLAAALSLAARRRPEAGAAVEAWVASASPRATQASNAAYLLAENGLLPELALRLAREAAREDPTPHVLDTLGWTLLRAGRIAEADRMFASFVPPIPVSWLHRASAEAAAGRPEAAARSLGEAFSRQGQLASRARRNDLLAPLFDRKELEAWRGE
jgi:HEAT repeat protein